MQKKNKKRIPWFHAIAMCACMFLSLGGVVPGNAVSFQETREESQTLEQMIACTLPDAYKTATERHSCCDPEHHHYYFDGYTLDLRVRQLGDADLLGLQHYVASMSGNTLETNHMGIVEANGLQFAVALSGEKTEQAFVPDACMSAACELKDRWMLTVELGKGGENTPEPLTEADMDLFIEFLLSIRQDNVFGSWTQEENGEDAAENTVLDLSSVLKIENGSFAETREENGTRWYTAGDLVLTVSASKVSKPVVDGWLYDFWYLDGNTLEENRREAVETDDFLFVVEISGTKTAFSDQSRYAPDALIRATSVVGDTMIEVSMSEAEADGLTPTDVQLFRDFLRAIRKA